MQTQKNSLMFYGLQTLLQRRFIDFEDSDGVQVATLDLGYYTPQLLAAEVTRKMNASSTTEFVCSYNRTTRLFTISGDDDFKLLSNTGDNAGSSVFGIMGFDTSADYIGNDEYTGMTAAGVAYSTQFPFQNIKLPEENRQAIDPVLNVATSGVIELIKFGDNRFFEGELLFITDEPQESTSVIRFNQTGKSEAAALLDWLTDKGPVELMLDENDVSTYMTLQLEATAVSAQGLDYDLVEMYDRGLPGYYRTGLLRFKQL